jgi:Xaa-Pro aminopeptidase
MGYLPKEERDARLNKVRDIMQAHSLDLILVYYDEFNIGNGWYLTGWCPQFESGAVLVPREGEPLILGGPESEPFAKLDSAVTETRNFPVFMVPEEEYPNATITDFTALFKELKSRLDQVKRVGLVGGGRMPADVHAQIVAGFTGVELVDMTEEYLKLRHIKSSWEREQIRAAFELADHSHDAMKRKVAPRVTEIEIAAAGEFAARKRGATGFGFSAVVGSGARSNAVVPTATAKKLKAGEMAMIGIAPKVRGYAGVMGDTLPVSGKFSGKQREGLKHLQETFNITKNQLLPGKSGIEIFAPAKAYYDRQGLSKYLVCPFVHTIGIHEAEAPFFGPRSHDVLQPGMTVCIDVSFFGHPQLNGMRIETGYEITEKGPVPMSRKLDQICTGGI